MTPQNSQKHWNIQEISKDSALRLNVEQMRYFGAILAQEPIPKTIEVALLDFSNNPHKETLERLF